MAIILFIIILLVLILVHEFGHFVVAKFFGIRVDEFGFGFPPRAVRLFKKGETEYTLNWIPFGGFVKIFGQDPTEENLEAKLPSGSLASTDANRSFANKSAWIQAAVLVAGVVMNFLFAWILLSIGLMSGLPSSVAESEVASFPNAHLLITGVLKNSPAEHAGLLAGDQIVFIKSAESNVQHPLPSTVHDFISNIKNNESVSVYYERAGKEGIVEIIPEAGVSGEGPAIGISMDLVDNVQLPPPQALLKGAKMSGTIFYETGKSFYTLIKNAVMGHADFSQVTGPVGIVGIVGDAYKFGLFYLLSFAAVISINLSVINLIPFPALDGGRLLFILIEKIKGKPIKPYTANLINSIGFFILIALMLVITYRDVVHLF